MTIKNRQTPEQKEQAAEKAAALKIKQKEDAGIFTRTFATEDGRKALRIIMGRCCYQRPVSFMTADGGINTNNMIHNGAMQGFYLWLRSQINNPEVLISVENKETPDE
jgi:hypothetical protein